MQDCLEAEPDAPASRGATVSDYKFTAKMSRAGRSRVIIIPISTVRLMISEKGEMQDKDVRVVVTL